MSLAVIATPIGHPEDITLKAIRLLREAEVVIGEERKTASRILRDYEVRPPLLEVLNEHSDDKDIEYLLDLCREKKVALISDCGTPGFCDPGQNLVKACRKAGIPVEIAPGASSLMSFLSGAGERIDQFYFQGFLPAKTELRVHVLQSLAKQKVDVIIMDTPYRLERTLSDLVKFMPERFCILGIDLTLETELFLFGKPQNILSKIIGRKGEFVLLIRPAPKMSSR